VAIYLSPAMMFLSQAVGVELSLGQQVMSLGILLLSSKGMAGVPGSAFVALSATAAAVGAFPVAAVALLLGADRLMDSMRVFTNLHGHLRRRPLGRTARREQTRAALDGTRSRARPARAGSRRSATDGDPPCLSDPPWRSCSPRRT